MKYELHLKSCPRLDGWRYGCDCDGPKKFEALMTAARDEITTGHAQGALVQAMTMLEKGESK